MLSKHLTSKYVSVSYVPKEVIIPEMLPSQGKGDVSLLSTLIHATCIESGLYTCMYMS